VPHPSHPAARGHLKLANAPVPRRAGERRVFLLARAALVALFVAWITAAAWLSASLALLPLAWRRSPRGQRLRPIRREARVIPFQPRERALQR
jgi:hypothetical protein